MTDSGWAWCIAAGLIVGFGIGPMIAGEIQSRRAMKQLRESEARAHDQTIKDMKALFANLDAATYTMMDQALAPAAPPPPPLAPPTLDVLAATAQQNPERWKDFLDV
jgi:hypothetical protein